MARHPEQGVCPPRLAARIVRAVLPPSGSAVHVADLDERFDARVRREGVAAARRWYWRQAIGFALRLPAVRSAGARRHRSDPTQRRSGGQVWPDRPAGPATRRTASAGFRRALPAFLRDLQYATRSLRARPAFAIPVIIVLALAIGANTTVLSIVDNVLLRDLPVRDAGSVVMAWDMVPPDTRANPRMPITYNHYKAWRERTDLFSQVVAMDTTYGTVATEEYPIRASGLLVSGETFMLLGAEAALGRVLRPDDDALDAPRVVVLSDRLWRRWFGADPEIVGRTITLNDAPVTVVGVMPADFWFFDPYMFARSLGDRDTAQPDLWLPLESRDWTGTDFADYPALRVMARLRDGVSVEAATTAARAMRASLAAEDGREELSITLVPLSQEVLGGMRPRLLMLQGAVTLLVLIACVNVMSLVLAKTSATRAELAVRAALGAGRASLVRLALCETALLGLAGGALGLAVARALGGIVLRVAPRELPLAQRVAVDGRVALITLAVAVAAGMLAGLVPALGIDFRALPRSLKSGSRSVAGSAFAVRARFALVAAEVALTLVLLIGAAVMLRSFVGVWRADPGFDRDRTLTLFTALSAPAGAEVDFTFHQELLDGIRGLPGVITAGGTTHLPFSNWHNAFPVLVDDTVSMDDAPDVDGRWITEGYLEAMGIEVRAGRGFRSLDDAESEPVVLINEAFASSFFDVPPASVETLVDRRIGVVKFGPREVVQRRIVGVVENVKTSRLFESDRALVYVPERQSPTVFMRYVVRAEAEPMAMVPAIRRLAAEIDPRQALTEILPLETLVAQSLTEERFYAQILTAFGLLAFAIAAAGIYGTVAYNTRLRLREIGIRIALGARPGTVQRLVVVQGLGPVAVGLIGGCAGAMALVRGLESLLHGVSPLDVPSFASGVVLFLAVAAVATLIPARRAAAVDPIEVLRSD